MMMKLSANKSQGDNSRRETYLPLRSLLIAVYIAVLLAATTFGNYKRVAGVKTNLSPLNDWFSSEAQNSSLSFSSATAIHLKNITRAKFLVIHIGVPKTGTTALQHETRDHLAQTLKRDDDAVWTGKDGGPNSRLFFRFNRCLGLVSNQTASNFTKEEGDQCWQKELDGPMRLAGANVSIVTSFEEYSFKGQDSKALQRLQHYFRDYLQQEVVLLVAYRRYHEWIFSAATQTFHRDCLHHNKNDRLWLDQGGRPCGNPWRIGRPYVMNHDDYSFQWHNIDEMMHRMGSIGFDPLVMNYHSKEYPSAITQNFYCGMLGDHTPHTCEQSKKLLLSKTTSGANSGGEKYMYDAIILEVAKRGWINTTSMMRHEARSELNHHHTNILRRRGAADLPLICPPQSAFDHLLEKSLRFERLMSPELFGTDLVDASIEAEHIAQYQAKEESGSFCEVDLERLLANVTSYSGFLYGALNRTASYWGPHRRYKN